MSTHENGINSKYDRLNRLSELSQAVSAKVKEKYPLRILEPRWTPSIQDSDGRLARYFHRLYHPRIFERTSESLSGTLPASMSVTLGVLLTAEAEASIMLLYLVILRGIPKLSILNCLILLLITTILFLIVLYSISGTYWTLYKYFTNKYLSKSLRGMTLILAILFLLWWLLSGANYGWDRGSVNLGEFQSGFEILSESNSYLIVAFLLFYIPVISLGTIFLVKILTLIFLLIVTFTRWVTRYHNIEPLEELGTILLSPLSLSQESESENIIELGRDDIEFLHEWAQTRREIIQTRLVGTTIFLGILSLFVGISVVNDANETITTAQNLVFFQPEDTQGFQNLLIQAFKGIVLGFLLILLSWPVFMVVRLLNEGFVMDVIEEASLIALYIRNGKDGGEEKDTKAQMKSGGLRRKNLLSRLFSLFSNQ